MHELDCNLLLFLKWEAGYNSDKADESKLG